MAQFDVSQIEGFEGMTAEEQVKALLGAEIPEAVDLSKFVSKEVYDKSISDLNSKNKKLKDQMNEEQQKKMERALKDKVKFCDNFDVELVYMIVPNQCLIYPETMPDRYERSTADYTLLDQFTAAAKEAGATVIDLYPIMEEHKADEFKIYHKTDSHWTDYGAYWGYQTLMNEIAKTFPDAAPLPIDGNLRFYTKEVEAGDMMTHFEVPNALVSETATFAEWLVDYPNRPNIYVDNRCEIDNHLVSGRQVIDNPNAEGKDLPSAMIIRDSFSFNAFAFFNQSFSRIHWNSTWDYQFKKMDIKKAEVDYLIYLVSEKSLSNILYDRCAIRSAIKSA